MNNVLHDRLFGTSYAKSNPSWLDTIDGNLLTKHKNGPLFYFGTQPNDPRPHTDKQSLGADIWALFCMSGVEPQLVREWFAHWRNNITLEGDRAWVSITEEDHKIEFSSDELATAWAFCVAKELGEVEIAEQLRKTLALQIETGFERDPLLSGLYVLGEELEQGAFGRLVYG